MELLRQTIRTLFFLQKSETVIRALVENGEHLDTTLQDNWFIRAYMDDVVDVRTKDQIEEVCRLVKTKWMKPDKDLGYMVFADRTVFNTLVHFTASVLTEYKDCPVCKYDNILRWNDLTLDLGEDLFTTAYLASKDVIPVRKRTYLSWRDIIGHDNNMLNSLFDKPMIDLHYHLNGSSFVFDLNWLSLMNDMTDRKAMFKYVAQHLSAIHLLNEEEKIMDMYGLVIIAAIIRMYLFNKVVLGKKDGSLDELLNRALHCKDELDFDTLCFQLCSKLYNQRLICGKRFKSIMHYSSNVIDYAIVGDIDQNNNIGMDKVYSLLAGERYFMYSMFHGIFTGKITSNDSTLLYIYLLIKTRFREAIVLLNQSIGFSNFQDYQNRKALFIKENSIFDEIFTQVAILSSLTNDNRYLEARITPSDCKTSLNEKVEKIDRLMKSGTLVPAKSNFKDRYSFILHFIKTQDKIQKKEQNSLLYRHYALRKKVKKQSISIKDYIYTCILLQKQIRVIGVDAASSEIACRPEIFGQAYRYLKYYAPKNHHSPFMKELGFTYHVGEDFLSVVDGLRAVYEALKFLHLGNRDRIGHGLVLGVDVEKYYRKRSNYVSMSKQMILDNVVWLYFNAYSCEGFNRVAAKLKSLHEKYYRELYGISSPIHTIYDYYQSWLLRGDDPEVYRNIDEVYNRLPSSHWDTYALNDLPEVKEARHNRIARELYHRYHYDNEVYMNGNQSDEIKLDKDIINVISQVQEKLLCEIEKRHIAIETNPTSNYRIGDFNRYDEHPLLRFFNYGLNHEGMTSHSITVSINTDDKGVFSTSLEREYSVMSAALEKKSNVSKGINPPRAIYDWLDRIREMGMEARFDK